MRKDIQVILRMLQSIVVRQNDITVGKCFAHDSVRIVKRRLGNDIAVGDAHQYRTSGEGTEVNAQRIFFGVSCLHDPFPFCVKNISVYISNQLIL